MTALAVIEGVALLLLALLVMGLLRSHADILRSLDELGVGRPGETSMARRRTPLAATPDAAAVAAAALRGHTVDGESITVAFGGGGQQTVLAFLSATCHTCAGFWHEFGQPGTVPEGLRVIAVVQGVDNLTRIRKLAGEQLMVVISDDAWLEYGVPGSPHFVLVDGETGSIVGEGTGSSWAQVQALLEHAAAPDAASLAALPVVLGGSPRDNALRIDRELADAGIGPGHPSLYVGDQPSAEKTVA